MMCPEASRAKLIFFGAIYGGYRDVWWVRVQWHMGSMMGSGAQVAQGYYDGFRGTGVL